MTLRSDRAEEPGASELDSLLVLMQDQDEVTMSLVHDRLCSLGWTAVLYCFRNLDRVIPEKGDGRAKARCFLRYVSSSCSIMELESLLGEGESFFVPDGLYFLTRILMPELTPGEFHGCYSEPAGDLVCELRDTMTAVEKVEMLNYIVFDRYGFQLSYDAGGYENTVLIPDIMDSRRAGVVGISAVYFLLASYAGLPVYPVFPKMPGYYVAYFEGGRTLFSMDMGNCGHVADPVPVKLWLDTAPMGTDRTILYLYATALRRFGRRPLPREQAALLDLALDLLKL